MAIIQSLRKIDIEAKFYNIDYFRYSHEEIEAYFEENQFDVVGISAVVSTAYSYTKYLSNLIRRVSPNTFTIVGGNLGASSEILLKKCAIDFCIIGDGEGIIRNLIPLLKEKSLDYGRLRATKGIAFLDEQQSFYFSGYGEKPLAEEIEFPDYRILEEDGSIDHFIPERRPEEYAVDEQRGKGKRKAKVVSAKGCVARCTFCHRFEQGFRVLPIDPMIEYLQHLKSKYDVGFIDVCDENFGSDQKATWELVSKLGELGFKWRATGVRTRTVTREALQHWKDNGCLTANYGIESGSPKMLEVMEKNLKLEDNVRALKLMGEVGLMTTVQLIIGMPGENDDTISETIDFLKEVAPYIKHWEKNAPSSRISINYAQALPGTPLYEIGRQHGLIGKNIDGEEKYLVGISNTDAYSQDHFINFTGLPMLKVLLWRHLMVATIDAYHYQLRSENKKGYSFLEVIMFYAKMAANRLQRLLIKTPFPKVQDSGYFNISRWITFAPLLLNPMTKTIFYPLLTTSIIAYNMKKPLFAMRLVFEYGAWKLKRHSSGLTKLNKSLRKIVAIVPSGSGQETDSKMMLPLRKGR